MFASKNAILKKSFDVRILFFASKNAILTKAFEARIVFLHRRFKNVNFEGGCWGQNLIFASKHAISKKGFEARIAVLRRKNVILKEVFLG